MRAWLVLLVVAFLAGCLEAGPPTDEATGDGGIEGGTESGVEGDHVQADGEAGSEATGGGPGDGAEDAADLTADDAAYVLDHAAQDYQDGFVTYVFEARENITYNVTYQLSWPTVTTEAHCIAFAMEADAPLATLVAWSSPANLRAQVRVGGEVEDLDPVPFPEQNAGLPLEGRATAGGRLEAGERLLVTMGGDTPDVFGIQGPVNSSAEATVRLAGAHDVSTTQGSLACGVGAEGAEDSTAGATFYVLEAEAGGRIAYTTTHDTTAFVVPGDDLSGVQDLALAVPGSELAVVEETAVNADGGDVRLTFHGEASLFARTAWLFADARWAT